MWVGWRDATLEQGLDELRDDSSLIESHSIIREAMYICPPLQHRNICMPIRMNMDTAGLKRVVSYAPASRCFEKCRLLSIIIINRSGTPLIAPTLPLLRVSDNNIIDWPTFYGMPDGPYPLALPLALTSADLSTQAA